MEPSPAPQPGQAEIAAKSQDFRSAGGVLQRQGFVEMNWQGEKPRKRSHLATLCLRTDPLPAAGIAAGATFPALPYLLAGAAADGANSLVEWRGDDAPDKKRARK